MSNHALVLRRYRAKLKTCFQRYYRIENTKMSENLTQAIFSRGLRFRNEMARFRRSLWCRQRWWLDWSTFSDNSTSIAFSAASTSGSSGQITLKNQYQYKNHKNLIYPIESLKKNTENRSLLVNWHETIH